MKLRRASSPTVERLRVSGRGPRPIRSARWLAAVAAATMAAAPTLAQPTEDDLEELSDQVFDLQQQIDELRSLSGDSKIGTNRFLFSGYITTGFVMPESGNSTFSTTFNPLFLWKLNDKLFISAELELELEDSETELGLEYANIAYIVNDRLTIRAGKFLTPLSTFAESGHPTWINKLPSMPLFAAHGHPSSKLVPSSSLGVEARGGIPVGKNMRLTYSAYVSNGPELATEGHDAGNLEFSNFEDVNDNKALGGRISLIPIPGLEIAYAFQYSGDVLGDEAGMGDVSLLIHDIAVSYVTDRESIGGRLDARAEFVFVDFDGDLDFGDGPFNNDRQGGYVQLAYRPTRMGETISKFEAVIRYDFVDQPVMNESFDETRYTFGINYWLTPSTVFKVAYQFDETEGEKEEGDALLFQFAVGF